MTAEMAAIQRNSNPGSVSARDANAATRREWTGREVRALRSALGMSVREFASRILVSDRAVSRWEASRDEKITRLDKHRMLDTLLERMSGDDAHARFQQLLSVEPETAEPETAGVLYDIALPYMEPRGMSARALARAVYRDPGTISSALRGKKTCGPALARDIDAAIGAGGEFVKAAARAESARRESAGNAAAAPGGTCEPVPMASEGSSGNCYLVLVLPPGPQQISINITIAGADEPSAESRPVHRLTLVGDA